MARQSHYSPLQVFLAAWESDPEEVSAGRYWQYRAVLHPRDGSNYPVLRRVELQFEPQQ